MMVHVEYATITSGAVMGTFGLEYMADETILSLDLIDGESLHYDIFTHWCGTLPGSVFIVYMMDQTSSRNTM